jgi:hypothetical protein
VGLVGAEPREILHLRESDERVVGDGHLIQLRLTQGERRLEHVERRGRAPLQRLFRNPLRLACLVDREARHLEGLDRAEPCPVRLLEFDGKLVLERALVVLVLGDLGAEDAGLRFRAEPVKSVQSRVKPAAQVWRARSLTFELAKVFTPNDAFARIWGFTSEAVTPTRASSTLRSMA